jgi:phage terminase large subunit
VVSASLKLKWLEGLEIALGSKEESRSQPDLAEELARSLVIWAQPLLQPIRYKCLFGGRGSGKSYAVADALLIVGLSRKIRVLCGREFQISIKDSVTTC